MTAGLFVAHVLVTIGLVAFCWWLAGRLNRWIWNLSSEEDGSKGSDQR